MTNKDSLSLTSLHQYCTNASFSACDSLYITSNERTCETLDIPSTLPKVPIYDGAHWYQIVLTKVP